MPALSSAHKSTLSLVVAPTQNTAPVHEYRCLYTRDLHKKAKKWHDGSLRFHTFNHRVMVYDDSKNYIGDLHYREEEAFGEGVEIQLDRGVIVEVGELSGQTETDLAPILNRQQPDKPTQHSKQRLTQAPRHPKSLLEVLGPSQSHLGRSRLPLQSPYEHRQSLTALEPVGNPSKRPRLSPDKENRPQNVPHVSTVNKSLETPHLAPPELAAMKKPPKPAVRPPVPSSMSFEEVVDITSGEEVRCGPRKSTASSTRRGASNRVPKPISPEDRKMKTKQNSKGSREEIVSRPARSQHQERRIERSRKLPQSESPVSLLSRPTEPPSARLLLSQPRPRKKLVYVISRRPGSRLTDGTSAVSPRGPRSCNGSSHSPIRIDASSPDVHCSTASTPSAHHVSLASQNPCVGERAIQSQLAVDTCFAALSPLFIPEEEPGTRSPSPSLLKTPDTPLLPDLVETQNFALARDSPTRASINRTTESDRSERNDYIVAGFEIPQSQPEQDRTNAPLPQLEPVCLQDSHSPKRALRRVLSEDNAFQGGTLSQDLDEGVIMRSPLEVLENLASRRSPSKQKWPSKLNRCASDTAALETNAAGLINQRSDARPAGTTGPWTSDEAFLLFDWWPSELEKPDLWEAGLEVSEPVKSPPIIPELFTRITTARQFFLNDVR
ncbi:uncharacterized protein A1O9_03183 [Exophiala aquamarina CBS 119918]|uniref:5'-3' DNA helicase ZGRF1-like N-terminal domain-containing protein n=1 Tax=Exophiala aquamarina CBS 119918 TaxID=1182545 RepID=A0A072Q132_9EURO|nr:uncharacterized protein A1O9_03183 [Exophiala aquamarina CBS 119918]KEF61615.1 hypothetical protein A1O9_03183 [Exophiala aquamarina CBS 119918]